MKRTKIVCTIGPASDKRPMLMKLIKEGMNVCRLNFSHNVHAYHGRVIKDIRAAAKKLRQPVAILQDLQGLRIRLADLPESGVELKRGDAVILTTGAVSAKKIGVTYAKMHEDIKPGERILIADGLIELRAEKMRGRDIYCKVISPGRVFSHKGINLPDTAVSVASLSEKDRQDLAFGVRAGVDLVALSFVRTAKDVHDLRKLINHFEKGREKTLIKIIVKVERKEAVDNIDEIIAAADGVMVARGDLGIELAAEDVPLIQKMIIDKCLAAAKPVIVATQMLESMINNPRPTRAEATDVSSSVIDHADAVMLSGETATGKFPVEAVNYMRRIIEKTEASVYDDLAVQDKINKFAPTSEAIASLAKILSLRVKAKMILVASFNALAGLEVARYRPELPIVVVCGNDRLARQMNLSWGITPLLLDIGEIDDSETLVKESLNKLRLKKVIKKKDLVIIANGASKISYSALSSVQVKRI